MEGFRDGDIIVASMINPAWLPYFSRAGGFVSEVGGWLSHPAILAREYDVTMIVGTAGRRPDRRRRPAPAQPRWADRDSDDGDDGRSRRGRVATSALRPSGRRRLRAAPFSLHRRTDSRARRRAAITAHADSAAFGKLPQVRSVGPGHGRRPRIGQGRKRHDRHRRQRQDCRGVGPAETHHVEGHWRASQMRPSASREPPLRAACDSSVTGFHTTLAIPRFGAATFAAGRSLDINHDWNDQAATLSFRQGLGPTA